MGAGYRIARGVWLEAVRRKEIYVLVLATAAGVLALAQIRFFGLESLSKFYREVCLKSMGGVTGITVVVLACRQLPREFETGTIYPLLARPVGRPTFLLGKLAGVMGAAGFCYGLFLALFLMSSVWMGAPVYPVLLLQHVWLQGLLFLMLASVGFALSLWLSRDMAMAAAGGWFLLSGFLSNLYLNLYAAAGAVGRAGIRVLTWLTPQFELFDLTSKLVHGDAWGPVSFGVMLQLTGYALGVSAGMMWLAAVRFRRRPL